MNIESAIKTTVERIQSIVDEHNIKAVYALFSGGDDSTVMAWLSSHHPLFCGVVFANTLTGDKPTIDYVRDTAREQRWKLYETKPLVVDRYTAFIATRGIPTPAMHPVVFSNLKGKPWEKLRVQLAKQHKCKTTEILFVSGVRKAESAKRQRTVELLKVIADKKGRIRSLWGAPIYDWSRADLEAFFSVAPIARNQHAWRFTASRECGCKATEKPHDAIIEREYYQVAAERRKLQYELARAAYALQQFELENGLIDPEDATIPQYALRSQADQGQLSLWVMSDRDEVEGVPFFCASCEGGVGADPDAELTIYQRNKQLGGAS